LKSPKSSRSAGRRGRQPTLQESLWFVAYGLPGCDCKGPPDSRLCSDQKRGERSDMVPSTSALTASGTGQTEVFEEFPAAPVRPHPFEISSTLMPMVPTQFASRSCGIYHAFQLQFLIPVARIRVPGNRCHDVIGSRDQRHVTRPRRVTKG
jgi:hypothetical protein